MTNIRDVVTEVFLHELAHKVCAIALNVNALFGNGHQNFQVICALTAAAQQVEFASELGAGGRNPVEPTAVEHLSFIHMRILFCENCLVMFRLLQESVDIIADLLV